MTSKYTLLPVGDDKARTAPVAEETMPVPTDIYGVTMTVVIQDLPVLLSPARSNMQLSGARLAFGLVAALTNVWLQLMILWNLNYYLVDGSVHRSQENYAQYHREVFDRDGHFLTKTWKTWKGPYMELCNMPVTRLNFASAIIFLWCARMVSEIHDCWVLTWNMCALQTLSPGTPKEMAIPGTSYERNELEEIETIKVRSVSRTVRLSLVFAVTLPKALVAMALLYCGLRFLIATESLTDIILNALALESVISIDNLMYEAFTPEATRKHIEKTVLAFPVKDEAPAERENGRFGTLLAYWLALLLVGAFSYVYPQKLQQVLPNFHHDVRAHCDAWFEHYYEPACVPFSQWEDCFPFGEVQASL